MTKFLVSGGSSGLGYHIVAYLLQRPNNEIFMGSRSLERGAEALEKLQGNPKNDKTSQVKLVQLDITDDESIKKLAQHEELQSLDVLLNNAGVNVPEQDRSNIRKVLEKTYQVNVFGSAALTEAFIPALKNSKQRASVVFVGSGLGSISVRVDPTDPFKSVNLLGYNSSKSALNGVMAYYCNALPEMRVVVVTPGFCATNLNGYAGTETPESGAETIAKVALNFEGKSGQFLHEGGIYPW